MPAILSIKSYGASVEQDRYPYGVEAAIEVVKAPKGLSEDIIRFISAVKKEPQWVLEWRLEAFKHWLKMKPPTWANIKTPQIDFNDMYYYAAPKAVGAGAKSLDEVDPEILELYEKLGIPLKEQEHLAGIESPKVAIDAIFDSVSVVTTFKRELEKSGVLFMSISEAIRDHPELVRKYLGSVVSMTDNFYASLNAAVFTDGSFVFVPRGVRCPMELSTYFRINEKNTGQFDRTLIIAEEGSFVSYLEGCTAPAREENQLHAAVVELVALDDAEIKHSTVQNWYPGDKDGKGGVYNFVTKRGDCRGNNSKITWTDVDAGSAISWKYPSCILNGDNSRGEYYSIAVTNNRQQVDSGAKMIHVGKHTSSSIISKRISAGDSNNTYRGLVSAASTSRNARNYTQCDALLIGDRSGANTISNVEAPASGSIFENGGRISKIDDNQLFYCMQRGIPENEAIALIAIGFVKDVIQTLPMEFAVESQKLISLTLEGAFERPQKPPRDTQTPPKPAAPLDARTGDVPLRAPKGHASSAENYWKRRLTQVLNWLPADYDMRFEELSEKVKPPSFTEFVDELVGRSNAGNVALRLQVLSPISGEPVYDVALGNPLPDKVLDPATRKLVRFSVERDVVMIARGIA